MIRFLESRDSEKWYCCFECDWDSFIFWREMNWRDFTFVALQFEFSKYKWIELHLAILGLHFFLQRFRELKFNDEE